MKTPREFIALVDRGILTTEIIASVLYSFNKRAKNLKMRDHGRYKKAKKSRNLALLGGGEPKKKSEHEKRIIEYYRKKDFILITLFRPFKIHVIDGEEFLFYRVYHSEFHFPVYMYEMYGRELPSGLEKVVITDFGVTGESPLKLLSIPFCDRVVIMIKSCRFLLVDGGLADVDATAVKSFKL